MSLYLQIDAVIESWVLKHGLYLYTACKDYEARGVSVVDENGRVYSIGIDPPLKNQVTVRFSAWDFKKRHKTVTVPVERLAVTLEDALQIVRDWMNTQ